MLGVKNMMKPKYHHETNRQYKRSTAAWLRHYAVQNQNPREMYVQLFA